LQAGAGSGNELPDVITRVGISSSGRIVPISTETCNQIREIMKMTGRLNLGFETTFRTVTAIFTMNSRIIAVNKSLRGNK